MSELPDRPPSNGQDNTDGVPTTPATTPQQKRLARLNLGMMALGFALYLAGRVTNGPYSPLALGGAALFSLALISMLIWAKARAKRDPVLAKTMAEARGQATRTQLRFLLASLAAIPFAFGGGVWTP